METAALASLPAKNDQRPVVVLDSIQSLRFIAAFLVVVYHAGIAGRSYDHLDHTYDHALTYSIVGEAGVHIFFVISGFLMVYTTSGRPAGWAAMVKFVRHRVERIYPIYWIYALAYLLFQLVVFRTAIWEHANIWLALALVPGHSAAIIGPGWTLGYEVFFYLIFGLSILVPVPLTLVIVGLVVIGFIAKPVEPFWHAVTNTLLLEFLAGAWGARMVLAHRVPSLLGFVSVLIGCVGLVLGFLLLERGLPTVIVWGIPSTLIVVGFVIIEMRKGLPPIFTKLAWLGGGSYSLYLLHTLVLDVVMSLVANTDIGPFGGVITLVAILVSLIAGHLACLYLERPLYERLRSRRTPGRIAA